MKQTGECTPLATPASSNLHSMQVPLVYVQPEAIRGEYMSDRNMGIPQPGDGPQFWKAGVFECLQNIFPNALMAWACPCVSLAQITSRLGVYGGYKSVLVGVATIIVLENLFNGIDDWRMHRENQQTFDDDVHESQTRRMGGYGIVSLLLCMALVCFVTALRTKVRTLYRIQGSEWEDFACSLCCMSCTIAQMSTQVGTYTPGECAFGPRDSLPRYTEHV
ncbi:hypothetical protein H310_02295 [Aphanomyces invadans]|uniref:PLAC8 family protein n=1 Tax=Aphanomyces invadans TaxID=157072 RepID=A0A024UNK9_9STRA|nr:hypothetical protein H310_02295 [Aphanomyces invadans]ETW07879.1 hypothetical protein H310_02295 [Aphanomyces invadans]|eukprot:XP_008863972.1 hypothetical protein H310_02295 [Aphanomyces invadans]